MIKYIKDHNTIPFAIGHLSRGAVVAAVGILYGVGPEADRIFLAYYALGIPLGVMALTVQFSISHMATVRRHLILLMFGGNAILYITAFLTYSITGDDLVMKLLPFGVVSIFGLLLYGQNAAYGNLRLIPVAQVVGAAVLMATVLLFTALWGVYGVAWSLVVGETAYMSALVFGAVTGGHEDSGRPDGLLRMMAAQLPKGLTLGLAAPALRLVGGFFGEGWISIFTYVSILAVTAFVVATAGYRATVGWRRASIRK